MENKNNNYLDGLLSAAASSAGEAEIEQYKNTSQDADISGDIVKNVLKKVQDVKGVKKGRLSFKSKVLIAAAAALMVCALAVGVIANKGTDSIDAVITYIGGEPNLTYDIVEVKSGSKVSEKLPGILKKEYTQSSAQDLADGKRFTFVKDDISVDFAVRVLDANYSLVLGKRDTEYFGVDICGKYHGYWSVAESDGGRRVTVAWNDGKYAYELCGSMSSEELIAIAESLY